MKLLVGQLCVWMQREHADGWTRFRSKVTTNNGERVKMVTDWQYDPEDVLQLNGLESVGFRKDA